MSEREDEGNMMSNKEGAGRQGGESLAGSGDDSKVISKGKARLIVAEDEPRSQSPAPSKPKEILLEPRVAVAQDVEVDPVVEVEDEVTRLERSVDPGKERIKVEKAKFEKLEERLDEAEKQEEQWGESRQVGAGTLLTGGAVVIVIVIAAVAMRGFFRGDSEKVDLEPSARALEAEADPFEGSPEKWFRDRSGEISRDALEVLNKFKDAPDDQARLEWVRNPEFYLEQGQKWKVKVSPLSPREFKGKWNVEHIENTGYLSYNTRNEDYQPCRIYFTRGGESLKLDWVATTAWSEVSLEAMAAASKKRAGAANDVQREAGVVSAAELRPRPKSSLPEQIYTDSVLVRCMIRKRGEYYTGIYNDQDHSVYQLLSPDKMHHMWGYVAKGSDLDLELRGLLDYGSFVVKLKKDKRVTIRVRINEKEALPLQAELVELVHPEWVTP